MTDTSFTADINSVSDNPGLAEPRLRRQQLKQVDERAPKIAYPASKEDFDALPFGSEFVDPEGALRVKPYTPQSKEDFDLVPEGAEFLDPTGQARIKPKYEGVDFTTQTLYDMALTDKERFKSLERAYPGKVKKEGDEVYVDDEGTRRKPGRGPALSRVASKVLAEGAPMAGMIGGTALGAAELNPVTTAGGMVLGTMLGQSFNDAILGLAGVYDRSPAEAVGNLGMAGASAMVGEAAGRGVMAAAPMIKDKIGSASKVAASFLGAEPEGLKTAIGLADKGALPPPSGWAKEAPHIQNIVEVFDPAFHTQKPLLQSATQHYEREGAKLLEQTGVKEAGSLVNPTAAVSTEKAGDLLLKRAEKELIAADDNLRKILDTRRTELEAAKVSGVVGHEARMSALREAERDSRQAAQKVIDEGFKSIQTDIDAAMKSAAAGNNSGELWQMVGERLKAVKQGISARAKKMYDEADELAGEHLPNINGLAERADAFLRQLPEGFEGKYPDIVRRLKAFAGEVDEHGQIVKDAVDPTFGQLHELRNVLRSNINYHDLTPGIREGVYKHFANRVNEILHDANAVPELKAASKALDAADDFYRKNMGPLTDKHIQAVVSGLESGMPADPKNLFDTLVKEGRSDLTRKVADLVGPNLWAGVKAADVQEMLDMSKGLVPGTIDGAAFARQVLDRHRTNMLEAVHGREASAKLLRQAQDVATLNGKLDIEARPGDTVTEIIRKAQEAAQAVKKEAKNDPLKTLSREMNKVVGEQQRVSQKLAAERKNDPLGFLYEPSTGASEAVDTILKSEDLILATSARFGDKSPEFDMLRQVWVQRILQNTMDPGSRLAKVTPEVQQIMFPGVTLAQMHMLAKEMDFLMSSRAAQDTAKSMAAVSKVEHPWASIMGRGGIVAQVLTAPTKIIPGADAVGRSILGGYYGAVRKLSTNPAFLRWVEKGLKGNEVSKQAVRDQLQAMMKEGQGGAAAGEGAYQGRNADDFDPASIGAQQAPDGHWYLPPGSDPANPDKYIRVEQ